MKIDERSRLIRKALQYAEEKHRGQVRKASGSPYIHHPIMVSYIAANYKKSKQLHVLIASAILHDVVEDTDASYEDINREFGSMVASIVTELSDDSDKIKEIGKVKYQMKKWPGLSNYALFLKLCDRYCNVSDDPKPQYITDTKLIISKLKSKRKLTKSQKSICKQIQKVCESYQLKTYVISV